MTENRKILLARLRKIKNEIQIRESIKKYGYIVAPQRVVILDWENPLGKGKYLDFCLDIPFFTDID